MKKIRKFDVLAIILIIIISIGIASKTFQNDTFYIIKVGELIVKNGIDMIDHFSIHNIMYPYEHFLYNIFVYFIYNSFGFLGLYISNIIFTIILGIIMYFGTKKLYKNSIISLIITLTSLLLLKNFIATRAQLISYIIFILEIYCLESLFKSGKKKYILFLFILAVLLANIHAAVWPMFFVLFMPYIASYIIFILKKGFLKSKKTNDFKNYLIKISNKFFIEENYNNIKYIILSFILCIIGGFINPNNNQCFTYFIKVKMGNTLNIISEHQPTVLYNNPCFLLYIFIIFLFFLFFKRKFKIRNLFLIFGLLFLALSSVRHIALFITIGSFILTESFSSIKMTTKTKKMVTLFVSLFIIFISSIIFYTNYNDKYISDYYPIKAANFINKNINKKNMRLFNEYNYGSYLLFKGIPVFIDSRANLYTKPFNKLGYDIFDDYDKIVSTGKYKKLFKKYKINHILIERNSKLDYSLRCNKNYKIIYKDKKFVIFKKN